LNLIYSLFQEKWLHKQTKVAVVGAGAAGLTAAVAAACCEAEVTILEQLSEPLSLIGRSYKRWLHPHIYEWPKEDPDLPHPLDNNAGLPLMNWQAGSVHHVREQLTEQYRLFESKFGINLIPHVANLSILPGNTRHFSLTWNKPVNRSYPQAARHNRTLQCDIVILAAGFGLERRMKGIPFLSYWSSDSLDEEDARLRGQTKRILVSGTGDGGLMDLLRIRLKEFSHHRIAEQLKGGLFDQITLGWLTGRLKEIETEAERAINELKPYEAKLNEEYQKVTDELSTRVDITSLIRVRPDTQAVLTGQDDYPLSLRTSVLNRLLYSLLPDVKYLKGPWKYRRNRDGTFKVTFANRVSENFDEVIIRHGPEAALERDFPEIWQQCSPLIARSILDQTRFPIYQEFFDDRTSPSQPGNKPAGAAVVSDKDRFSAGYVNKFLSRYRHLGAKVVYKEDEFVILQLNASEIFRRFDSPILLILTTYSKLEEGLAKDLFWLDTTLNNLMVSNLLPLILSAPGNPRHALRLLNKTLAQGQPVLRADRLLAGLEPVKALREAILEKIGSLEVLSPYRIDKYPQRSMFVGREALLHKLLRRSNNHFIVGSRRIGKSTLAIHVQRELGVVGNRSRLRGVSERPFRKCAYVDVSALGQETAKYLWGEIIRKFDLDPHNVVNPGPVTTISSNETPSESEPDARVLDGIISQFEGELTIILDEVDGWIEQEAAAGWPTVRQLRALTSDGRVRVILVGYESLMVAIESKRFPFHQCGETCLLGPLDRAAVDDLVRQPLAELNVRLEPESEMLETIWRETSGLPHLVQDICAKLLALCDGSQRKVVLTNRDLSTAISNATSLTMFRIGVFRSSFPLAEFIAGVTAFTLHRNTEVQMDDCAEYLKDSFFFGKDYITTGGIRDLLDGAGYKYDDEDFTLALNNLKLNLILRAIDEAETMWSWVNQLRRETMITSIRGLGYQRWENDNKEKHHSGKWRGLYKI
jgi:hypothetical protein